MEMIGPIHNWVFNKIKFQESEVAELLQLSDGLNVDAAGVVEEGNLSDFPQITNIHGFLQQRIIFTEQRLALAVETLLEKGISLDTIKTTLYNFGKNHAIEASLNASEAYKKLGTLLVNGMPCDRVETLLSDNTDEVTYQENTDIHSTYWTNKALYQELKDVLIEGLLSQTSLQYSHSDKLFTIKEK